MAMLVLSAQGIFKADLPLFWILKCLGILLTDLLYIAH